MLLIISQTTLLSQDSILYARIGVYGGINFNFHSADFTKLKDIDNCCPAFESGAGNGINTGLLYEMPISKSSLLGVRLGLISFNGTLINREPTMLIVDKRLASGEFTHTLNSYYTNLGLEPYFSYRPFYDLFLSVGLRAGVNIKSEFDQKEEITKPSGVGTFFDKDSNDTFSRIRNQASGDIPEAIPTIFHLFFAAGYELPLNKNRTMLLVPEMQLYLGLNEFVKETNWYAGAFRIGVSLKYSLKKRDSEIELENDIEDDTDTFRMSSNALFYKQRKRTTEAIASLQENHKYDNNYINNTLHQKQTEFSQLLNPLIFVNNEGINQKKFYLKIYPTNFCNESISLCNQVFSMNTFILKKRTE